MRAALFAVGVAVAGGWACAANPGAGAPAPRRLPVGTYTFNTIFQGQAMTGKVVIQGSPGAYTGMIVPHVGPPPVPIDSVAVEDTTVSIYALAGNDDLVIMLAMSGEDYVGTWMLGFDSGNVNGSRLPLLDPVGLYDFTMTHGRQSISGLMEITGSPGAYRGTLQPMGETPATITSVTVDDQVMTINAYHDDESAVLVLEFNGTDFTGTTRSQDQVATVTAVKRAM